MAITGRHAEDAGPASRQSSSGLVAALDLGIERANARLIARMDADDIALPERFERQMARMAAEPDLLVLGTATIRIDAERNHLEIVVPPGRSGRDFQPARARQPIAHPTVVMRRDALEAVGFYRRAYLRPRTMTFGCGLPSAANWPICRSRCSNTGSPGSFGRSRFRGRC